MSDEHEYTNEQLHGVIDTLIDGAKRMDRKAQAIRSLVDEQAEDGTLWFPLSIGREADLQAALRKLHALVEADLK